MTAWLGPGGRGSAGYALELGAAELARYKLMAERAREVEADLWRRAGVVPGAHVADIGCGPGAMLPMLAAAVGPTGRVTGIDADPAAVAVAGGYAAGSARLTVREGRADRTGLPPESVDVVMLRHVLAHNGGREDEIVGHLATLLRPGGVLYLVDTDNTAARMVPPGNPDLVELQRRYFMYEARRGNDMQAGLRLADRLRRAGLEVVEFRGSYLIDPAPAGLRPPSWAARDALVDAGLASSADIVRWAGAFEWLDALPVRPILFAPFFVALGRRPA